jgi:hypothetical protein
MVLIALFLGLLLAAAQALVDLRIRSIRAASVVPVSELRRDDPVRRRFGVLHGVSMILLLAQTLAAAAAVISRTEREELVWNE